MKRIGEFIVCRDITQLAHYIGTRDPSISYGIISLDENNSYGYINGGILLPPLRVMYSHVECSPFAQAEYAAYLNNDRDCNDMLTTIVTALYKGRDVIFLLGENMRDQSMLGFIDTLLYCLRSRGLNPIPCELKTPSYYPGINIAYLNYWVDMMISYGKISDEEYQRFYQKQTSPYQKL